MPRKPRRGCARFGCPNYSVDGSIYCEMHKKQSDAAYDKNERAPDHGRNYGRSWRKLRERYAREHPACEICWKEGRLTPTEEVHHIIPLSRGGKNAYDNLMSLCRSCHAKLHKKLGDR